MPRPSDPVPRRRVPGVPLAAAVPVAVQAGGSRCPADETGRGGPRDRGRTAAARTAPGARTGPRGCWSRC